MARRTVYGHAWSENGWPMVDTGSCQWITVPGTSVTLQIATEAIPVMRAFAADFNKYVEPLRDADSACWTPTNSVATSNHLSGTGMDLNWNGADGKTFRLGISAERAYPGDRWANLQSLLEFYEGTIFCGGFWSIKDWMHFQMGGSTYDSQKTRDFIARKIRADGYSTYRRGDAPNSVDAAVVLSDATGLPLSRATEILPAVRSGLIASECINPNRIAMWLAQIGHESASFKYTEEIAKNGRYAPYIGRTWIQITWDYNYRQFSKWAHERGICPTPTYFVDHPQELANLEYAGVGAAWYWTVARPQINSLSDNQQVYSVTRAINGGLNGIDDRVARYRKAQAVGSRLLAIINDNQLNEWEALMADTRLYASASPYRTDDKQTMTPLEILRQTNGMVHARLIEEAALQGDPKAVAIVAKLASGEGPGASDKFKVEQAKNIIRIIKARLAAQGATQ